VVVGEFEVVLGGGLLGAPGTHTFQVFYGGLSDLLVCVPGGIRVGERFLAVGDRWH
jgi:hypothetical protein